MIVTRSSVGVQMLSKKRNDCIQYSKLKKFLDGDGTSINLSIPKKPTSHSIHNQNVKNLYTESLSYRKNLPSFHIGYDSATKKLIKLADKHGFSSKQKLLELCCGFGTTLIYLGKNYNFTITGVDLVKAHVQECNKKIIRNNLQHRIKVIEKDILTLPVNSEKQDIIFSEDSFSHITDRKKLFSKCYDLLNPGGLLVFSDLVKTAKISNRELNNKCRAWCLHGLETYSSYLKLAKKTGFKIRESQEGIGIELLKYHIKTDVNNGDSHPKEYFQFFKDHEPELIRLWGKEAFNLRRERLMFYPYILDRKLDYAFFVLTK